MTLQGASYLQRVPIIHTLTSTPTHQHPELLYNLHTVQIVCRLGAIEAQEHTLSHSRRGQMEEKLS